MYKKFKIMMAMVFATLLLGAGATASTASDEPVTPYATGCALTGSALSVASYTDGRQIGGFAQFRCNGANPGDQVILNAGIRLANGQYMRLLNSNDPTGQSLGNNQFCVQRGVGTSWTCTVYLATRPLASQQSYRIVSNAMLTGQGGEQLVNYAYTGPLYSLR